MSDEDSNAKFYCKLCTVKNNIFQYYNNIIQHKRSGLTENLVYYLFIIYYGILFIIISIIVRTSRDFLKNTFQSVESSLLYRPHINIRSKNRCLLLVYFVYRINLKLI